jgi:DNA-binding CsgD family transcriptional regulator
MCSGGWLACCAAYRLSMVARRSLSATGSTSSGREIANRLLISVRTVTSHRDHVMQKLRLETRAQLVLLELSSGVVGGAG